MKVIVIVVVKARNRCWFKTIASEIGQNRIGNSWYIVTVVFVVAAAVHIVVPVDPRNLPLRFGQNRVNNRWDLVVVVIIVVVDFDVLFCWSQKLTIKVGQNRVNDSWDIANIEFLVGGGWTRVIFMSNATFMVELQLWQYSSAMLLLGLRVAWLSLAK